MHPTGGSRRVFKQFVWLEVGSGKVAVSHLAHQRVTLAVSPHDHQWSNGLESDRAQRSNRLVKIGCISLVALSLLAIVVFIVYLVQRRYPPRGIFLADENDPSDVALAFAYSLPFNKMTEMKSYIVQEKWEFVEKWPEIHQPISKECLYPSDPDFQNTMMLGPVDNGGSSSVSLFYAYDCPDYGYWFDLGGLELKLIDGKWQIIRWEKICEERGVVRRCLGNDTFVWRSE